MFCIVILQGSEDYEGESSGHDVSEDEENDGMDEESRLMASMGLPVEFGTSSKKASVSCQTPLLILSTVSFL